MTFGSHDQPRSSARMGYFEEAQQGGKRWRYQRVESEVTSGTLIERFFDWGSLPATEAVKPPPASRSRQTTRRP